MMDVSRNEVQAIRDEITKQLNGQFELQHSKFDL